MFPAVSLLPVLSAEYIAIYIWIPFAGGFETKSSNQKRIDKYFTYLSHTKTAAIAIPALTSNSMGFFFTVLFLVHKYC